MYFVISSDKDFKFKTLNDCLYSVRAYYRPLGQWKLTDEQNGRLNKLIAKMDILGLFIHDQAEPLLLQQLMAKTKKGRFRTLTLIAWFFGLRKGEISRFEWKHLNEIKNWCGEPFFVLALSDISVKYKKVTSSKRRCICSW